MFGYYGSGCNDNSWLWIVLVIFIVFFICCNNRNHGFNIC